LRRNARWLLLPNMTGYTFLVEVEIWWCDALLEKLLDQSWGTVVVGLSFSQGLTGSG